MLKNQITDPFRNEIHFYGIGACTRNAIWSKCDIDLKVGNVPFTLAPAIVSLGLFLTISGIHLQKRKPYK